MVVILNTKLDVLQQPILTQEQRVSLKILAMGTHELNDYIYELMLSNPAVDIDRSCSAEKSISVSFEDAFLGYNPRKSNDTSDDDFEFYETISHTDESLHSFLRVQTKYAHLNRQDEINLTKLIDHVDSRGYISEPDAKISRSLRIDREEYQRILSILQGFEPAGVGARNLSECLLLQLKRLDPRNKLAENIAEHYLTELGGNKLPKLVKLCNTSLPKIIEAKELIASLQPVPYTEQSHGESCMIIPDIIVRETQSGFDLCISGPACVINPYYKSMLNTTFDADAKAYIGRCFKEIQSIQCSLERRERTLLSIAKFVIEKQEDFFLYGEAHLKSLRQSDVSSALRLHDSTISRAIKDKYLQCRWGTFPLKRFFSAKLDARDSAPCLNPVSKIKELIDNEPSDAPLSDQKIADILNSTGFDISRRTVTQYRLSIGIGSALQRKKY